MNSLAALGKWNADAREGGLIAGLLSLAESRRHRNTKKSGSKIRPFFVSRRSDQFRKMFESAS